MISNNSPPWPRRPQGCPQKWIWTGFLVAIQFSKQICWRALWGKQWMICRLSFFSFSFPCLSFGSPGGSYCCECLVSSSENVYHNNEVNLFDLLSYFFINYVKLTKTDMFRKKNLFRLLVLHLGKSLTAAFQQKFTKKSSRALWHFQFFNHVKQTRSSSNKYEMNRLLASNTMCGTTSDEMFIRPRICAL